MAPPLYRLVIDTVVERIATGALQPGAMLPSETQLGAELGVSQGTARKALMELEARGLVQRAQGRGTFVTMRTPESSLFHFFRLRQPDGSQVTPRLEGESLRRRRATAAESRALHGQPEHVFEIERLRRLDARHLVHEMSAVPVPLFPGLAERAPLPNTLYVFYQQAYSCIITRADERLRAIGATGRAAEALELAEGTPVMSVERLAFDALDRAVERRKSVFRTDAYDYFVSLS